MVDRIKVNLTGLGGTLASTEELQIVYPGSCAGDCAFRDGEVNVTDLLALLGAWERIRKRAGSSVCPEQVPRGSFCVTSTVATSIFSRFVSSVTCLCLHPIRERSRVMLLSLLPAGGVWLSIRRPWRRARPPAPIRARRDRDRRAGSPRFESADS